MVEAQEVKNWLAERRKGLFSTDAAAICGRSPWRTAWEVFLDKTGQLPDEPPSERMLMGLRLEGFIAELYQEKTKAELTVPGLRWHPEIPWMGANCDRLAPDRIVELKFASTHRGWGEEATDEIPDFYNLQVHHQMIVMGMSRADLAVFFGSGVFRIFPVQKDPALAAFLVETEAEFWRKHILLKTPPEPDWEHKRTQAIVKALYPATGGMLEIGGPEILEILASYEGWAAEAKAAEAHKDALKAKIIVAMGNAAEAVCPDGTVIRRPLVQRKSYSVPAVEYYGFKIQRGKND